MELNTHLRSRNGQNELNLQPKIEMSDFNIINWHSFCTSNK